MCAGSLLPRRRAGSLTSTVSAVVLLWAGSQSAEGMYCLNDHQSSCPLTSSTACAKYLPVQAEACLHGACMQLKVNIMASGGEHHGTLGCSCRGWVWIPSVCFRVCAQAAINASAGARTVSSGIDQQFCIVSGGVWLPHVAPGAVCIRGLGQGQAILVFKPLGQAAGRGMWSHEAENL